MLFVEIEVFGIASLRLTVGILIGYSSVCTILLGLALYFAYRAQWDLVDSYLTFVLLGFYLWSLGYFLVTKFGRFVEAVSVADRGTALSLCAWVYGPLWLTTIWWCCGWVLRDAPVSIAIPGLRQTGLETSLRAVAILASATWVLVSAPIARLWATNIAQDPETLLTAEESLFISDKQREFEAQVSLPTYYALVLSIMAIMFLILESIIGESIERMTGVSGYVGSAVAALGVAASLYPINRRFNAFVANMRDVSQESGRADSLSALKSAVTSTHRFLSVELGDIFYVTLAFIILGLGFGSLADLA